MANDMTGQDSRGRPEQGPALPLWEAWTLNMAPACKPTGPDMPQGRAGRRAIKLPTGLTAQKASLTLAVQLLMPEDSF